MDTGIRTDAASGDSRTVERDAAAWLARRDRGHWSPADADALERWLDASAAHRVAFLRLQSAWEECGRLQALGAGVSNGPPGRGRWAAGAGIHVAAHARRAWTPGPLDDGALQELVFAPRRRPPDRLRRLRAGAAIAASVFLAATLGAGLHGRSGVEAASYSTVLGHVESLPLSDGSTTVLGSDSRMEVRVSRNERLVDLQQGEAFFDVARDARRPFVVQVGDRRVRAVGTRFSVRRDGPDLQVVVTEGLVQLEAAGPGRALRPAALLPAGSVALAGAGGVLVRAVPQDVAERMVGWQDGMLAFRDTPLADAVAEFNRYNARPILVGDEAVGALRIDGSFRWSNAEGFVRLLEQGFPVRAEYAGDRIVLHGD